MQNPFFKSDGVDGVIASRHISDHVKIRKSALKFGPTSISRVNMPPPMTFGRIGDIVIVDDTTYTSPILDSGQRPRGVGLWIKISIDSSNAPQGTVVISYVGGYTSAGDVLNVNGTDVTFNSPYNLKQAIVDLRSANLSNIDVLMVGEAIMLVEIDGNDIIIDNTTGTSQYTLGLWGIQANQSDGVWVPFDTSGGMVREENRLRSNNQSDAKYVGTKPPDNIEETILWTLPARDGDPGQVLATDGSGILYWATDQDTEGEIPSGGTSGQVLATDGSGNLYWKDDLDTDTDEELPAGGTSGQVLATNGDGTYYWKNDADTEGEIPSGGTSGQVLATDGSGNLYWKDDLDTDTDEELPTPVSGQEGHHLELNDSLEPVWTASIPSSGSSGAREGSEETLSENSYAVVLYDTERKAGSFFSYASGVFTFNTDVDIKVTILHDYEMKDDDTFDVVVHTPIGPAFGVNAGATIDNVLVNCILVKNAVQVADSERRSYLNLLETKWSDNQIHYLSMADTDTLAVHCYFGSTILAKKVSALKKFIIIETL